VISQVEIEDSEGEIATIYGLSKDESSLIVRLANQQLLYVPVTYIKTKSSDRYSITHSFAELHDMPPNRDTYPVIEEKPIIGKKTVETGRIQIKKTVEEVPTRFEQTLNKEEFQISSVAVDETRDEPAQMRTEGDLTIIPVQEEVLVVIKKYLVREEIQIRKVRTERTESIEIPLKKESVSIDKKKVN
jgi:uncharacterized protein (TIGR02271 family)